MNTIEDWVRDWQIAKMVDLGKRLVRIRDPLQRRYVKLWAYVTRVRFADGRRRRYLTDACTAEMYGDVMKCRIADMDAAMLSQGRKPVTTRRR